MEKYKKERDFEEQAFSKNKGLFLDVMGADDVVSTAYLPHHLAKIDFIGMDCIFSKADVYRTASLRIRKDDWQNITLRGHITEPFSQTKKIQQIISLDASYADFTVQLNGVDHSTLTGNGSIIRVNNRILSNHINNLHNNGELDKYFRDFGSRGRFYEFSYDHLQKHFVFPYIKFIP